MISYTGKDIPFITGMWDVSAAGSKDEWANDNIIQWGFRLYCRNSSKGSGDHDWIKV